MESLELSESSTTQTEANQRYHVCCRPRAADVFADAIVTLGPRDDDRLIEKLGEKLRRAVPADELFRRCARQNRHNRRDRVAAKLSESRFPRLISGRKCLARIATLAIR